jgi:hypothetical protein
MGRIETFLISTYEWVKFGQRIFLENGKFEKLYQKFQILK